MLLKLCVKLITTLNSKLSCYFSLFSEQIYVFGFGGSKTTSLVTFILNFVTAIGQVIIIEYDIGTLLSVAFDGLVIQLVFTPKIFVMSCFFCNLYFLIIKIFGFFCNDHN